MPLRNLLKTTPPEAVRTLDELFAIAQTMEHEAATRYTQLAGRMRSEGNPELAELFERLASDEREHEASVMNWSEHRSGKVPDAAAIRWELPDTFDQETAEELASSRLINPYRVLSMAVRNEERAFTLWSYIAAEAKVPEIQQAAERMAHEELEHVSSLRKARRSAYHAQREGRPAQRALSVGALLALTAANEAQLAIWLEALADRSAGEYADQARELAATTRDMAATMVTMSSSAGETAAIDDGDAPALAERLVEAYLDISDRSGDEVIVASVQILARQAIARLAWLRHFE